MLGFILEWYALGLTSLQNGVAVCTKNYKPCVRIIGGVKFIREVIVRNCRQRFSLHSCRCFLDRKTSCALVSLFLLFDFPFLTSVLMYIILLFCNQFANWFVSYYVTIRASLDPPHPLVCQKRRRNVAVLRMRPEKPRSRITAGIDWLTDYLLFYVSLKNFSHIQRRHHCRWRATNLGLCSALRAFEQEGIFIVSHLLWHRTSFFPVSSEGSPHSVAFNDTRGD
jgi:hypothetical protein